MGLKKELIENSSLDEENWTKEWTIIANKLSNMFTTIGNSINSAVQSEAVKKMGEFVVDLHDYVSSLPKIEFSEETKEIFKKIGYVKYLQEIQWPLFLYDDNKLRNVLEEKKRIATNEQIENIILDYFDVDCVNRMTQAWKNSNAVTFDRLKILEEAINLYKGKYYYGCVSILVCQLEGIINETYEMQEYSGQKFRPDDIKEAYEYYTKRKLPSVYKISNEKSKLLCMVTTTTEGMFYWMAVVDYIYNIVLTSKDGMENSNHPCRNKICHGIQLNFGTKEHALKAILTVDMVLGLAEEIRRIIELKKDKNTEDDQNKSSLKLSSKSL